MTSYVNSPSGQLKISKSDHLYCFNRWLRHPKSGALQCGRRPKSGALQWWRRQKWRITILTPPIKWRITILTLAKKCRITMSTPAKKGAKSGRELHFSGNSQGEGVVSIVLIHPWTFVQSIRPPFNKEILMCRRKGGRAWGPSKPPKVGGDGGGRGGEKLRWWWWGGDGGEKEGWSRYAW